MSFRAFFSRFVFGVLFWISFLVHPPGAFAATHTVSMGDTLWGIGRIYNVSASDLMDANSLQDSLIYPGQVVNIPGASPAKVSSPGNVTHTVQPGDTLYLIGQKNGVDYNEIIAANHLQDTFIYPGMELTIPVSNGRGSTGASSTAQPEYSPQVSRGGYFDRPSMADVDLLARLITAEADNQPYEAKVAVGAVVLNRLRHKDFPKTIAGVINQKDGGTYQFEPVMNGWINRPASPDAVQAAKEALGGADPTNGALYFFCDWVTNKWLTTKKVARKIGETIFSY